MKLEEIRRHFEESINGTWEDHFRELEEISSSNDKHGDIFVHCLKVRNVCFMVNTLAWQCRKLLAVAEAARDCDLYQNNSLNDAWVADGAAAQRLLAALASLESD